MNLHVYICSTLHKGAGGCEIWLEYFINNIIKENTFDNIYIYYADDKTQSKIKFTNNNVFFVSNKYFKKNGILTVIFYTIGSSFNSFKYLNTSDKCILIGPIYNTFIGFILYLYNKLFNKNLLLITWIRSIAIGEFRINSPVLAVFMEKLEKCLLQRSSLIICNGSDTYKYYKEKFNLKNIKFINNALSSEELFILNNKILKNGIINIGFLGRYCYAKGFDKYLDSVKLFLSKINLKKFTRIKFHAYGYGELENKIDNTIIENHGKYESSNLLKILRTTDIVVFFNESGQAGGVSHSLLEAMASGRVIVAWDNLIHRQVIDDDAAIFIKENDICALVDFYVSLIDNSDEYFKEIYVKTLRAKQLAEKYTPYSHVKEFLKLINK